MSHKTDKDFSWLLKMMYSYPSLLYDGRTGHSFILWVKKCERACINVCQWHKLNLSKICIWLSLNWKKSLLTITLQDIQLLFPLLFQLLNHFSCLNFIQFLKIVEYFRKYFFIFFAKSYKILLFVLNFSFRFILFCKVCVPLGFCSPEF